MHRCIQRRIGCEVIRQSDPPPWVGTRLTVPHGREPESVCRVENRRRQEATRRRRCAVLCAESIFYARHDKERVLTMTPTIIPPTRQQDRLAADIWEKSFVIICSIRRSENAPSKLLADFTFRRKRTLTRAGALKRDFA